MPTTIPERVRLDPKVPNLGALGVESVEQLLADEPPSSRAEELSAAPHRTRVRFPLPGTPTRPGSGLVGAPRGIGTGWVVLERFTHSPLAALFASRFTQPRSLSLAERHWNLLCHLRSHGVGTPEPLAVGARGAGLVSRDSFLVTREVEGFERVPDWLETARGDERRRGLVALGALVARLFAARVVIPNLGPEDLLLSPAGGDDAGCGAREPAFPGGLEPNRMPSALLDEVDGGVIRARLSAEDLRAILGRLDRPDLELAPRERLRVARAALSGFPREFAREVLRPLVSS